MNQFTQDEDKNLDPFSAIIWGEDTANAELFAEVTNAVSGRTKTSASVTWATVPQWTTEHEQGEVQQTPDLMTIIDEITANNGWANGNAMAFIIEATGTRTAESYDGGGEAYAPKLVVVTPSQAAYQPQSSDDDAEEGDDGAGVLDIDSSDLEIVQDHEDDPSRNQTVGIRFRNVSIPQGAQVLSAYVQFCVDETDNTDAFSVTITGEANAYPDAFTGTTYNISSQTRTTAAVSWADAPQWTTKQEAGEAQQTPDLTAIVQEIVNRADWYGGNNLALIFDGEGKRVAESFDGAGDNTDQRPPLVVTFVGDEESPSVGKVRASWNDDPATTMVIGWDQLDGTDPVVKWDTTDHGRNASAYPNTLAPYKSNTVLDMHTHFARFSGLAPGTMHYFVIEDSQGVSQRYGFLTAPDTPQPFAYIAGGDTKSSGDPYAAVQYSNKMVAKLRPLFVLFSGDGTDADAWKNWLSNWSAQTTTADGRLIPHIAVHGNHENGDYEVLHHLFDTPATNGDPYNYYALTFGGNLLKVFALNSELQNGDTWAAAFERQNLWLAEELADSQDIDFLTAGYHKPLRPHTAGKAENLGLIESWADLFYNYGLDISCDTEENKYTAVPDNILLSDTPYFGDVIKSPFTLNAYTGAVPSAPTNLAGEALSYTEIVLTWENTAMESVQKIELERKIGDGDWEILSSQIQPALTRYTLTALQDGVEYSFRMRARNIFGYSEDTDVLTVATPTDPRLKVEFQQGLDGYDGTVDLEIRDARRIRSSMAPQACPWT